MDIRDRNGNRIGTIKEEGSKLVGRDNNGTRVGTYDPSEDVTRDANQNRVGTGNQLSTLIQEAQ